MSTTEKYEIRNRWTGAVLFVATITCSPGTHDSVKMGLAVKEAVCSGANLSDAYLSGADLSGADLSRAKGIQIERVTHLAALRYMPTALYAFKVVNEKSEGHINGGLKYEIGKKVEEPSADTDPNELCSRGIHVADLPWCLGEWREGYRILLVKFTAKDIACVPLGTDGKFRLFRCTPVRDITDELRTNEALPALPEAVAA